jgi:hypothetical protein
MKIEVVALPCARSDKLPPATEAPGMSLGAVLAHRRFKFKARN